MKPPARGAASARARAERDARVDHVIDLMTRGEWHGARSHRDLAAKWKCGTDAVKDYAREASGFLRRFTAMTPEERDDARAQLVADVQSIYRKAIDRKGYTLGGDEYDNPDLKHALVALDHRAKVLGLYAPEKVEHEHSWQGLSPDERWKQVDEAQARLDAIRVALPPRKETA